MRILMVSSYLPYPLYSGGDIRLYNLMKNLKKDGYKITLICEKRDHQTSIDVEKVSQLCEKVLTVPRKKQWTISNMIKAYVSLNSFLSVGHNLSQMTSLIAKEVKNGKYDLIHVETFYVFQNVPATGLPIVLVEHNVEYMVYKRFADKAPLPLRPILNLDVWKIKKEEEKAWKKATALVAVSQEEKEIMKIKDVWVVPNGVDLEKFDVERRARGDSQPKKVLFIGNFKYIQNIDSADWIIKNVWPKVLKKAAERKIRIKLWVVGKNIPQSLKSMESQSILFDENAPVETEQIYKEADLLLAPIKVGGGTSFKILESMATGLPVLTTKLGNEGINGVGGRDFIIDGTAEEFAADIILLLTNKNKYGEISENAKSFIMENFDWKNITKKLEEVYKSLA